MPASAVADPVITQGASAGDAQPVASPSILSRLRSETRAEHEAVERVLDLMDAALTCESYRARLQQFYGFYAPLEAALQARGQWRASDEAGPSMLAPGTRAALVSRLNKTAHLRQDLHALGVMADDLPLCSDLPALETQAEVLGCLYVLEGATLGGRMITGHIQATLGITPAAGGSFFEGYGAGTGKMWQTMRQLLVSGAPDMSSENTMVASATATFSCLRRWCQSGQTQKDKETHRNA
jgi:heme oxygenase (biliverdin-IX-beta and delta-forming)